MIPGEAVLLALLEIVRLAMEGQTPEQRAKMWDWYIQDITWWRRKLGIDTDTP